MQHNGEEGLLKAKSFKATEVKEQEQEQQEEQEEQERRRMVYSKQKQ